MNQPKQKPSGPVPQGDNLYAAQKRRTIALAIREEVRNKKLMGELVSKADLEAQWFKVGRQVRDALSNVPARIAGLVAAEKKQERCFQIIEKEIRQALESLQPKGSL
jgi:phage terminase Nu1 subunit (DNA packaging protein)